MIRSLLVVLLAAAPAFAGSQKTSAPDISVHSVPGVQLTIVGGVAPALGNVLAPAQLSLPNVAAHALEPLKTGAQQTVLQPQAAAALAPNLVPEGFTAGDGRAIKVQAVDPNNAGSVRVAESLNGLAQAFVAPGRLSDVDLSPLPGHAYMPSPQDWRDEEIYSIMIDRFAKKGGATHGDPKKGDTRHGGNLAGLREKLSYIPASTIMLSPVTKSLPEAYHNYAPLSLMEVDPYFGDMAELKATTADAHAIGKRVLLDIVINHTGPVFEYEGGPEGSGFQSLDKPRKNLGYWTNEIQPVEFKDPERFTMRGVIDNWNDPQQSQHGDFPPNYRHLRTDERTTQDMIIKVAKWWIKETDVDGFRLDAVKHVDPAFIARFKVEIKEYAASLGKSKFFILGENSSGVDEEISKTLKLGVDSAYNYPEYRRANYALHGKAPASELKGSVEKALAVLGSMVGRLARFIDLHDTYRFLRSGEDARVLKVGLAFLFFSIGIPLLYYGTEQGFRQDSQRLDPEDGAHPADPANREDMFAEGQYKSESSKGDKFDEASEMYGWTKKLVEVRRKHAALRRGEQWVRYAQEDGPGMYAFSRILDGQEVLVVMNTSDAAVSQSLWVDSSLHQSGAEFADELDPTFSSAAAAQDGGGVKVSVEVPPRGVRVLVRKA